MPSLTAEDERIIAQGLPSTTINYSDPSLQQVRNDTQAKVNQARSDYGALGEKIDNTVNNINSTLANGTQDIRNAMNEQTQANIDYLNNQMDYAKKDYQKEARGAYADYEKQIDPYGVNAEYLQRNGLNRSGYSETARISAYTAYQNRVATARESWNRTYDNFVNQIAQAKATNNLEQAKLSYQTLQAQMSNLMSGLQYNMQNYQNMQSQINTIESQGLQRENMQYDMLNNNLNRQWTAYNNAVNRKYDIDQYNENMAYQRERDQAKDAQWREEFDYNKANNDRNYELSKSNADRTYELNKLNSDRDYEINKAKINASLTSGGNTMVTQSSIATDRNGNTVNMAPATETIIRDLAPKVQDYTKRYGVMMNQEVFANGLKQYILNELNKYNITDAQKKTVLQTMKLM